MAAVEPCNLLGELHEVKHDVARATAREIEEEEKRRKAKFNDGFFGRIAKSPLFEQITISVIVLNAVEIGVDADYSARWHTPDNLFEGPVGFIVCEVAFCIYFSLEILIRFIAYRIKWLCLCDGWFVFDSTLVTLMIWETVIMPIAGRGGPLGQLTILRLLRLLRITRMAKLMRAFPQLMMIVKGISAAVKAVSWTAVLLLMVTYTFSILFTSQFHQGWKTDEEVIAEGNVIEEFFGSMGKSMLSLLVMGTILDDVTACTDAIRATGKSYMLGIFLFYILLNSFTMMNMLLGILVEVVGNTADSEREQLVEDGVKEAITTIFDRMDKDGSGKISRQEFLEMKRDPTVMAALEELDIKEKQFDMYVDLLFQPMGPDGRDDYYLSFTQLLDCICRLRPGAMVSALDFAAFREGVHRSQLSLQERASRVEKMCAVLAEAIQDKPQDFRHNGQDLQEEASRHSSREACCTYSQGAHQTTPQRINTAMLAELEHTASSDIIKELQTRLHVKDLEETGVPLYMMDEELQNRVKAAEAFQTLYVPQTEWTQGVVND